MKNIFTFLVVLLFAISATAQDVNYKTLFDFEDGVDTLYWNPFANGTGTKADVQVVLNPMIDEATNGSDSVLWMHIYTGAESWVGYYVDFDVAYDGYYTDESAFSFEDDAYMMSMMVYKPVESPSRIKVERSLTGADPSTLTIADTNTVVNQWQFLEYDFSQMIGHVWQRLTIFPESTTKGDRTEEVDVYIDNIGIQDPTNTSIKEFEGAEMKLYPNPVDYRMAVVYPGMTGVKISNINGQEIRTINFGAVNSKVVEVGDLNAGNYFVTALTPKGNYTMPFIKK
jgi:hypothetical protein